MISDNVEFLPPIFMPCFGSHFENGRHLENAELLQKWGVKIQHCPISSKFDMWVDSVSGRFGRLHNR
jgi:hypothetical protein